MTFTPEQQLTIKALADYIREENRLSKQMNDLFERSQIEGMTPEIVALSQQVGAEMNALEFPPGIHYLPKDFSKPATQAMNPATAEDDGLKPTQFKRGTAPTR